MAKRPNISELVELSVDERLQLVEDLWDSIASVPDNVRLTDAQKRELDRTLDEYHRNPQAAVPWDEFKKRLKPAR